MNLMDRHSRSQLELNYFTSYKDGLIHALKYCKWESYGGCGGDWYVVVYNSKPININGVVVRFQYTTLNSHISVGVDGMTVKKFYTTIFNFKMRCLLKKMRKRRYT